MLGWIPYFLIFLRLIPGHISLHIFVLGMSALWSFLLHSTSDMVLTLWFYETPYDQALIIHTLSNLLLFILLLPWERRMFARGIFFRRRISASISPACPCPFPLPKPCCQLIKFFGIPGSYCFPDFISWWFFCAVFTMFKLLPDITMKKNCCRKTTSIYPMKWYLWWSTAFCFKKINLS